MLNDANTELVGASFKSKSDHRHHYSLMTSEISMNGNELSGAALHLRCRRGDLGHHLGGLQCGEVFVIDRPRGPSI